jgi:hypothetical protein
MWKDRPHFHVGETRNRVADLCMAAGNVRGMGAISTTLRVRRGFQEWSLASLSLLQPAFIARNGDNLY